MGPRLLCGLAYCASFFLTMPVVAKDSSPAKLTASPLRTSAPSLTGQSRFMMKAAAVIAARSTMPGHSWSDIDRDRALSQFRLAGGGEAYEMPLSRSASLISKLKRREDARGMTFGFDGGGANLGPSVDAAARPAEVVAYKLSEASSCNGLMPGIDCSTIGGDDVSVRLALALNF